MAEELRFAMRCHGARQRPALRRSCHRCAPGSTYVPSGPVDVVQANGVSGGGPRSPCGTPGWTPPATAPAGTARRRHLTPQTPHSLATHASLLLPDLTPPPPPPPMHLPLPEPLKPSLYPCLSYTLPRAILPLPPTSSLNSLPPPPSPTSMP